MKIIAASIIRNEEKYIDSMLKSVNWVDEIVLYNDHSIDNTMSKVLYFSNLNNNKVKIIEPFTNNTMFSVLSDGSRDLENEINIRNAFLSKVFSDYSPDAVVLIDGDELISIKLKKYICKVVKDKKYDSIAFTCNHLYDSKRRVVVYPAVWNGVSMIDPHVRVLTKFVKYKSGEYPGVPDCMLKFSKKTLCLNDSIHYHLKYLKSLNNINHSLRFLPRNVDKFENTEYVCPIAEILPVDIRELLCEYTP